MTEDRTDEQHLDIPEANISEKAMRFSPVWIVPMVAVMIGAWLVYSHIAEQGPMITLQFETAEGLEAGKTKIRYRDVDVGLVEEVRFSEDLKNVLVVAELAPEMRRFISHNSHFWVIRPRVGLSGVSGLGTLISGAYIQMDPGPPGNKATSFIGLEEPPAITSDTQGTTYQLLADDLGSVSMGSPVYFRQIPVGEVVKYHLMEDHQHVSITLFIRAPHDQFVRANTKFWNAAGIKLDLNSEGVHFEMESIVSLVSGGIAFESSVSLGSDSQAARNHVFKLYENYQQTQEREFGRRFPYLLHFVDTVRGLSIGASVEFRGIRVGTVKDIALQRDVESGTLMIPVVIEIEPERIPNADAMYEISADKAKATHLAYVEKLVSTGLRARLQSGNLLTGQLYIELDLFPDESKTQLIYGGKYPELPTLPRPLLGITASVGHLLNKLEQLPIAEIGQHAEQSMASLSQLIASPEVQNFVKQISQASTSVNQLAATINTQVPPLANSIRVTSDQVASLVTSVNQQTPSILRNFQHALLSANKALKHAENTLSSVSHMASPQGQFNHEILKVFQQLTSAARAVRIMAEYLERHPEALIKGKR